MKSTLMVACLGIVAGVAGGYGTAAIGYRAAKDHFAPNNAQNPDQDIVEHEAPRSSAARPRIQVMNGEKFDFGKMGRNAKATRTFYIRNIGNAPLQLKKGETTCKCTLSTLDDGEVAPGQTVEVQLEWTATTETSTFNQLAEIITNDPERPIIQLRIEGLVEDAVRVVPESVVFLNVAGHEPQTREAYVLGASLEDKVSVTEWEFTQKRTADYFDVAIRDLTPEEVKEHAVAKTGQAIAITLKPGLPTGDINQTLRVKTSLEGAPDFFVSIGGNVLSDVSIVGRGAPFDPRNNVLKLGGVDQATGVKAELMILIKGANREKIKIELDEIDPPGALRVTLGEPKVSEKMVTIPLTIEVPPGADRVTRLGSDQGKLGRILLRPVNSLSKELPVYVLFSVN